MTETKQGTKHKSEQERRRQILECALDIFLEKGFTRTTLKDIMTATQLSKGAIYHYFTGKEDIFHSLIRDVEESAEIELEAMRKSARPFDFIEVYMRENLDYFVKLYRLNTICHEMTSSEPIQSSLNRCLDMYKKAIDDAVESSPERSKELTVKELSTGVFLMLEGVLSMAASAPTFDVDAEFTRVLKVIQVLTRT